MPYNAWSLFGDGHVADPNDKTEVMSSTTPKESQPFYLVLRGLLAGVSNVVAISILSPLDVLKIRFQTQGELAKGVSKDYAGIISGAARIIQEEGIRGLFKGLPISCIRELTFSSTRMGLYEPIRQLLVRDAQDASLTMKAIAGLSSGALAATIFNPTDIMKVRFQADKATTKELQRYKGVVDAFMTILRTEGFFHGLYKGVATTTLRAAILTGSQLASYDHSKHMMMKVLGFKEGFITHTCASIIAGLATTICTNPVDVVRTRIFNEEQKPKHLRIYSSNPIVSLFTIGRKEGLPGLYKGFWPSYLRMGTATIIVFVLFERLRNLVGMKAI